MYGNELPPGLPPLSETYARAAKFDVATELMITTVLKIAESAAGKIEALAEEGKLPKRAAYLLSNVAAKAQVGAAFGENTPEFRETMVRFMNAGWVPPVKDSEKGAADGAAVTHG
ncbi:Uncharacterised protein [Mycobacteroides abscessus subsp. abscessus]|uniref:hypothetical protein n=1 Tax=Mycobacteroides abscessus TaxID=36809 RepID=UPI0009288D97|nr:hypothetical protein [Mycobacteroides abscessus]SIG30427.1 Uncharacterised protein [Mycobacteroides abscessus subsp. abscessus]SIH55728.1 Uncharacterised protein [Mycobacteroides abscessus subsp. abscessus]SKW04991.1 Uncharacterised protein [Mycobacteroides abscessus subsp. abscessus]